MIFKPGSKLLSLIYYTFDLSVKNKVILFLIVNINVINNIILDFLKDFKFARIFNNSKFSGSSVGLEYKLKDLDVVEIHV